MSQLRTGPAFGIIVAAGRSERMGGTDKIFAPMMGRPLITWTLAAFRNCPDIDGVIVVAAPEAIMRMRLLLHEWRVPDVVDVVPGGARRQDSVRAGLEAAATATVVAIHDGARPLVTPGLITTGIEIARETGAAICALPARDTVKEVEGEPPTIVTTHDRARIWLAQTPQAFDRELLLRAYAASNGDATDDATLVERLGHGVRVYAGDAANIKVTTRDDLVMAETLMRARLDGER